LTVVVELKSQISETIKGLQPSYFRRLSELQNEQASTICDYISALRTEMKLSNNYKISIINTLITLSRITDKLFKDFTRIDVIRYLNKFRRDDLEDPAHRWVGSYNTNLINLLKFFKWLYYPDLEPAKRPKPVVVQNLPKLRRREISGYKPSDMWSQEDNLLFLKYCPNARDRCFHAMEIDLAGRPHELLNLRIGDIEFIEEGGHRYARIVLNGKTGQRTLALIDSIPYVAQWISLHPQQGNREAFLFPIQSGLTAGKAITVGRMREIYSDYKEYFKKLLSSDNVIEQDKQKIEKLLRKRWNTYVHRHSAITEKSGILTAILHLIIISSRLKNHIINCPLNL
jgi:integrase/recombinase XerD